MKIKIVSVVVLIFTCAFSVTCLGAEITPDLEVSGIRNPVTVRRDSRSIPYIKANNLEDLYFVQGYETARDRLWQMDLMRRVAGGRLSELFGKQTLAEDKRWRTFGFKEIAEKSLLTLSPELKSALESYARGVNAYIASVEEGKLPLEFQLLKYKPEKWKPADTVLIGKILSEGLSTTYWQDINRLELKKLPKEKYEALTNVVTPSDVVLVGKDSGSSKSEMASVTDLLPFFDAEAVRKEMALDMEIRERSLRRVGMFAVDLAASNNWVISGKRTIDGKALLANDPHLEATAPGIWYLAQLKAPGMHVSGVTFPGVPGIVLGHNEHFAWGATNVGPDVQDVYIETFNDKGAYKTPNGWEQAKVRKEIVKFRANPASTELTEEVVEVLETRNGVVFGEVSGKKASLKWTAFDPANQEFEAFIKLNSAKDWSEFRKALSSYGGATQNFVYADVAGNIGWQVAGKIPVRRSGFGAEPYDGATNLGDWGSFIKFDELPRLYNPPSGFIVTANQRIVGTDYRHKQLTRQIAGPWRARRIFDLLSANTKVSMNDVSDIQHDTYNIPLSGFSREIVRRNAAGKETMDLLKGWDGRMTADSKAALVANAINACVGSEIAAANKGVSAWQLRQFILPFAIPNNEKLWIPENYEGWDALLRACDEKADADLKKNAFLQKEGWRWGNLFKASFNHPLSVIPLIGGRFKVEFYNVDGSGQTPNVGASVSMRHIAKPANWDETRHVIPLGQSGDSASKHWNDQFEFWRTGKAAIFPFSEEAVAKNTESVVKMKPATTTATTVVRP